ncbi:hypothetical protein TELCIR_02708 [Teladorsagia circumcincta]|uniref:TIL domain-containing protein n=1 Tax=Teladorsagia circumcincta TaxID=45464 RepID=A0A2G9V0I0_TELCI|nr:hypothetical protein TELCIR_02708 [Teladorsagia circumcincta]
MFHKAIIFILLIAVVFGDIMECKGKNEVYYGCKPGGNSCNFEGDVLAICRNGCSCKQGYKYNEKWICVPIGPNCK